MHIDNEGAKEMKEQHSESGIYQAVNRVIYDYDESTEEYCESNALIKQYCLIDIVDFHAEEYIQ